MSCVLVVLITSCVLCITSTVKCVGTYHNLCLVCWFDNNTNCFLFVDDTKSHPVVLYVDSPDHILLSYMLIVQITSCPTMIVPNVCWQYRLHPCVDITNHNCCFVCWWSKAKPSSCVESIMQWEWLSALQWGIWQLVALQWGIWLGGFAVGYLTVGGFAVGYVTVGGFAVRYLTDALHNWNLLFSMLMTRRPCYLQMRAVSFSQCCTLTTVCHLNSPCSVQMKLHQQMNLSNLKRNWLQLLGVGLVVWVVFISVMALVCCYTEKNGGGGAACVRGSVCEGQRVWGAACVRGSVQ